MIPARGPRTTEAWRVAAVAILLAVTVTGLRARGTFSRAPNSAAAGAAGAVLAIVLSAAEGLAFVAFIRLPYRPAAPPGLIPWYRHPACLPR